MLHQESIWIIGASEGIGAALAKQLAARGARLILSARSAEKLHALSSSLNGGPHRVLAVDVTNAETIRAAWDEIMSSAQPLDRVIYNAGAYTPMGAAQFDLNAIEQMLDVNLHGALRVLSHVLPEFMARNAGTISLVASVAGYRGLPGALGYGASKAALIHLAENLRADLARTQVKIQLINPGFVKTRLTEKNVFHMPAMVTPEAAAQAIVTGIEAGAYEIHFPKRFTRVLKLLQILPAGLYFWLLRQVKF